MTLTSTELYVKAAAEAGCPTDQIRNFVSAGLVLQPKQLRASAAARLCDREGGPIRVGFGGSRGSAKSHWALSQLVADDCIRYPGLKCLYLRKVGKTGSEAVEDLCKQVLHSVPHEYLRQKNRIEVGNGSRVILGHYQNEKDIDNYLGLEYDVALIEEATQLSSRKVKDIGTCVRSSKPGWRPREYYTTNPGNIGHTWFKEMFIVPLRAGAETSTRFIQAFPWDNAALDPAYRAKLEALTGWQRAAWYEGSWDIAAGQYFTNYRREAIVRELGPLPQHWRTWGSFDYGFQHFTAVYLFAEDGDGNVWAVDEHAEQGWVPRQHAEAVHSMLARHGRRAGQLETIAAGGDCFNSDRYGKSTADDYAALGLTLSRANLDRVNGAAEMVRRLGSPDSVPPRPPTLFIDPRCARLIECLPALQRDPKRPEDVKKWDVDDDGLGGDDFYDSCRYGLMFACIDRRIKVGANPFG